eukprot:gene7109-10952_t
MRAIAVLALCVAPIVYGSPCQDMEASWYDSSRSGNIMIYEDGCRLFTPNGEAVMAQPGLATVAATTGQWATDNVTGVVNALLTTIVWSNGATWSRIVPGSTFAPVPATPVPVTMAPTGAPVTSVPLTRAPATDAPATDAPVVPETDAPATDEEVAALLARINALEASWAESYAAVEEQLASCSGCSSADATIAELQRQIRNLTEVVDQGGLPGRDGYCMVPPTVDSVYVPVIRYPHKGFGDSQNDCTIGGSVDVGTTDPNCVWGHYMTSRPIYAYVGDSLVFWRGNPIYDRWNLAQLETESAYINCHVDSATLVAGRVDFASVEATGENFTLTLSTPGTYYYTSMDSTAITSEDRSEDCRTWHAKIKVVVLDPGSEVLAECPLHNPNDYGVGGTEDAADSATVQKLKGAVAAMGRQIVATEQRTAERLREEGQSGVTVVRTYHGGTDSYYSASYSEVGAANIHNHADTHHTVGLGEFGAVLNGVQFTTRHNDYSLLEPDDSLTVDEYTSKWPPKAKVIEQPPVPPSVLNAGSVQAQLQEMREYFRAFHTQNLTHRDYRPYFQSVMCYLEGTWTEAADDIAEPFASERHHIDADTWTELTQKNNFLFNNGQKDNDENLPYLPTSFRGMKEDGDDTFEPIMAQWFYRISCKKLSEHLPTTNLRVRNDVHLQMAESTPATRAKLASNPRALFDLHPNPAEGEWPKGKTSWEFLDDLMYNIPGFDGPNANLVDNSFGETCGTYQSGEVLNSARYTRYFALLSKDAMGRSTKKRSFNDMLFAAQTTHPRVSPQAVCEGSVDAMPTADARDIERIGLCETLGEDECRSQDPWTAAEVTAGSSGAKCMWVS